MTSLIYLGRGATGGIGQALCERRSRRGAGLVLAGRDPARLEALAKRTGGEAFAGVAPGLVRAPLTERLTATPTSLAASESMHPLGRIGEPEDVASAIAWLLDSRARG